MKLKLLTITLSLIFTSSRTLTKNKGWNSLAVPSKFITVFHIKNEILRINNLILHVDISLKEDYILIAGISFDGPELKRSMQTRVKTNSTRQEPKNLLTSSLKAKAKRTFSGGVLSPFSKGEKDRKTKVKSLNKSTNDITITPETLESSQNCNFEAFLVDPQCLKVYYTDIQYLDTYSTEFDHLIIYYKHRKNLQHYTITLAFEKFSKEEAAQFRAFLKGIFTKPYKTENGIDKSVKDTREEYLKKINEKIAELYDIRFIMQDDINNSYVDQVVKPRIALDVETLEKFVNLADQMKKLEVHPLFQIFFELEIEQDNLKEDNAELRKIFRIFNDLVQKKAEAKYVFSIDSDLDESDKEILAGLNDKVIEIYFNRVLLNGQKTSERNAIKLTNQFDYKSYAFHKVLSIRVEEFKNKHIYLKDAMESLRNALNIHIYPIFAELKNMCYEDNYFLDQPTNPTYDERINLYNTKYASSEDNSYDEMSS
jgi:hypothetical protein